MKKKLTSRQLQAIKTKQRIHKKAMELFNETDYEGISIAYICKSLNISVGNFYNYYTSKEELLMESYPLFDSYVETNFECEKFDSNIAAIRHLIFKQTNGASLLGPKIYSQMLRIQIKSKGDHVIENSRAFHICLENLVQSALDSGEIISNYSANEISSLLLRISRGTLLDWAMQNGQYCVSERTLQCIDMILNTMKGK